MIAHNQLYELDEPVQWLLGISGLETHPYDTSLTEPTTKPCYVAGTVGVAQVVLAFPTPPWSLG